VNVKVICHEDFRKEITKASKILSESISTTGSLLVSNNSTIEDMVQKYISFSGEGGIHKKIISPMILDAVIRSELSAGGSGEICLKMILSLIEETRRLARSGFNHDKIEEMYSEKIDETVEIIRIYSKKLKKNDIHNLIDKKFNLKIQKKIAFEIIEKSSIKSPVFLEKSNKKETKLFFHSGFNFKIKVDQSFLPLSNMWKSSDVSVMVIDGMIESVGEIHHLLERASSESGSFIIFVRSLSDDVRSTLLFNVKRKTINLIPVEVGFDESTINILNDISICCNSDVVSSLKGDLISKACTRPLSSVSKVTITENGIDIINDVDREKLKSHLEYLVGKRDDSFDPSLKDIFDKRIKSISSGKVILSVGQDILYKDPSSIERFDKFFREFQSLVRNGVIYSSDLTERDLKSHLKDSYPYSSSSLYFSMKCAISIVRSIFSIKSAIIADKD
jgi:hypothetical protein